MKSVKRFSFIVAAITVIAFFGACAGTSTGGGEPLQIGAEVYSLATDSELGAVGSTFQGSGRFLGAGAATLTIVDNGGNKAIQVSGRSEDWHSLDIRNFSRLQEGNYTITVTGRAESGATVKLSQVERPWDTFVEATAEGNGAFSLTHTFDHATLRREGRIRIQTEASIGDFYIYSLTIVFAG